MSEKGRSPWAYAGIGCTVVAFAMLAAVVAFVYWFYQSASKFKVEMDDPSARAARAKTLLGSSEIPEGYHASLAVSVPFLMDIVILGDREPEFGKDGKESRLFEQRGFVYMKLLRSGKDVALEDLFSGKADGKRIVPGAGVELTAGEEIGRGSIEEKSGKLRYLARRGTLSTRGQTISGITSFLSFECPGDARSRIGIWFGPDVPAGTTDLAGTPADESAIREFTSHFSPCAS